MTSGNRPEGNTGAGKLYFPFHYGRESESYAFYRIPKILFRSDVFKQLSIDAKLLYGMLLDRMELSSRNGWIDEEGKVYIYFTRQSVMEIMDCGSKKAGQLLAELDGKTGIGLITRVRQGLGKPDRIYVRKCITPGMPVRGSPPAESALPDVSNDHIRRCQKDTSAGVENAGLEESKGSPNHTEKNNTEMSDIDPIVSEQGTCTARSDSQDRSSPEESRSDGYDANALLAEYQEYRRYFEQTCCADYLRKQNPMHAELVDEILELLTETCCSKKPVIRVGCDPKPSQVVKARLMKLETGHIQYVMDSLMANTTRVRNIRQYLLTALYNAPATIDSYYTAQVNYDMYGER